MSVIISVTLVLLSFLSQDQGITNGLLIGSVSGISFFLAAWWMINIIVREKNSKSPNPLLAVLAIKIFILKFPLLGVGLWYAFKYIPINPFALAGGISVTQVAILIAGLSKLFNKQAQ